MTVYGTRGELYKAKSCTNIDIGNSGNPFDNGYFKKLYLIDDDGNSKDVASLSQKASTSDIRLKSHIKSTSQSALPLIILFSLKNSHGKNPVNISLLVLLLMNLKGLIQVSHMAVEKQPNV